VDEWKRVSVVVAVDCPEYLLELQEYRSGMDQMMFIHLAVHTLSKASLKTMLHDFRLLREHVTCPLYAFAGADVETWPHFVALFGFKPLASELVCENGQKRQFYIHVKDAPTNDRSEHGERL
jgi:hypothetical protein